MNLKEVGEFLKTLTPDELTELATSLKGSIVILPWVVPALGSAGGVHADGGGCPGGCPKGYSCNAQTGSCEWDG